MGKKEKKPRQAFELPSRGRPSSPQDFGLGEKRPHSVDVPSFLGKSPAWRFQRLEMVDPFGWHRVSREDLERIRLRLANFETMSWSQILIEGKKQNHAVSVQDLEKSARDRLEKQRFFRTS